MSRDEIPAVIPAGTCSFDSVARDSGLKQSTGGREEFTRVNFNEWKKFHPSPKSK